MVSIRSEPWWLRLDGRLQAPGATGVMRTTKLRGDRPKGGVIAGGYRSTKIRVRHRGDAPKAPGIENEPDLPPVTVGLVALFCHIFSSTRRRIGDQENRPL